MDAYTLTVYKGSTFSLSMTLKNSASVPINLTDYEVSGFIKYKYSDSGKLANLNATRLAPYTGGNISLSIVPSGTSVLPCTLAVYDVEIRHTGSGIITKVLGGPVKILPEATY